jgi:hypothetical protein
MHDNLLLSPFELRISLSKVLFQMPVGCMVAVEIELDGVIVGITSPQRVVFGARRDFTDIVISDGESNIPANDMPGLPMASWEDMESIRVPLITLTSHALRFRILKLLDGSTNSVNMGSSFSRNDVELLGRTSDINTLEKDLWPFTNK